MFQENGGTADTSSAISELNRARQNPPISRRRWPSFPTAKSKASWLPCFSSFWTPSRRADIRVGELRRALSSGDVKPANEMHWRARPKNLIQSVTSGVVAQLGERRNRTAEVEGSTPFDSTIPPLSEPDT